MGSAMHNTGWLVADKVFRMGVGLAVGIWIARYLGPENFGLLAYAVAFVSLFSWLSDLGLDRLVVRELLKGRLEPGKILGSAFVLKLIGGFIIVGVATAVARFLNPGDMLTIVLVAITAAGTIAQAFDVVDYHFQSVVQSKYATLARSAAFQALSLVKLILIFWKAPLVAFAIAGSIEMALTAVLLFIVYRRKGRLVGRWQWDFETATALLRDSWPLMFSSLMIMAYMRIDQVMLKSLSDVQEIGKYAGSVRLSEGWYFVLMAISTSIFPKLVDAHGISEARLESDVRRSYSAVILVGYAFAIPLSLFSTPISNLLYGTDYRGMEGMLAIGAWAGVFVGIALVRGAYCTVRNLNKFLLCSTTLGAVLNIGLNFALLPRYGGRGAAIATLLSYAVAGFGTSFLYGPTQRQGRIILELLLPWNAWRELDWREVLSSFSRLRG